MYLWQGKIRVVGFRAHPVIPVSQVKPEQEPEDNTEKKDVIFVLFCCNITSGQYFRLGASVLHKVYYLFFLKIVLHFNFLLYLT